MPDFLEQRWQTEIEELQALADRTEGKLTVAQIPDGVRLKLRCRSPVRIEGRGNGEPEVRDVVHDMVVLRGQDWPAVPVLVIHLEPATLVHPNVLHPGPGDPIVPGAPLGVVCYQGKGSSRRRLTDVVSALHALLGYRYGRFSRNANDCLSPYGVRYANTVLERDPGEFPTERSPLVAQNDEGGEEGG